MEYLDFKEISKNVPYKTLLNYLNIGYSETREGLKGQVNETSFKVDISANMLYYVPSGGYASPIQFLCDIYDMSKREGAQWLKKTFLTKPKEPKREMPELSLTHHKMFDELGITDDTRQMFEAGYSKNKGAMQGKIAFKVYDKEGNKLGYMGWKVKEKEWYSGCKKCVYNLWTANQDYGILTEDLFEVLYLHQLGFPFAYSLMAPNMNERQEEELKRFRRIVFLGSHKSNIVPRLSRFAFVKAPEFYQSLFKMSFEDVKALF